MILRFLPFFITSLLAVYSGETGSNGPQQGLSYLGQTPPGEEPEIFAPGFISTGAFEFAGTFSPDGKEYYFTRRPDYSGSDNRIYYTRIASDYWSKPRMAPFAKDVFEFLPSVSPDGTSLYFGSDRKKPQNAKAEGNIWYAKKEGGKWTEPLLFENELNQPYTMGISVSATGSLYYTAVINGKRGIFRSSFKGGEYQPPDYLPEVINDLRPAHPYIAPDESFLLMDAQISGMGKPEIFVSFKNKAGMWTKPINLGPVINQTRSEFAASLSPDGKYLFFHRRTEGNGDIYWVDAKVMYKLKPLE